MSSNKKHTDEFITKIFKLSRERGLTARQIAEVVSPEYKDYNGVDMSRNAVIGILNRYDDRFTHMGKNKPKKIKRVSFVKVAEQLEQARQSMKDKDKYKVRKCLSCRKEKLLHKVMFVCDNCKSRASYSSYIEDHSVRF